MRKEEEKEKEAWVSVQDTKKSWKERNCGPRTLQQVGVLALGGTECELVQREAFAASRQDALASSLSETQGSHSELGHLQQAVVVDHSGHHHGSLLLAALHVLCELGEGQAWPVDARHVQAAQYNLRVEWRWWKFGIGKGKETDKVSGRVRTWARDVGWRAQADNM